jgi:transcriptional regulator with XRE-family HTH domain
MEIKDKILKVRMQLNLSQEALAEELGVAFATVNRWEKGHREPSILTKHRFDEFCKKNNIRFEE